MDENNFELINEQIKSFISSYQENPFIVPLKRILSLHKRLVRVLKNLKDDFVREIMKKMEDTIQAILFGDESMLHSVDKESYHILLWKLHQYLIREVFPRIHSYSEGKQEKED